MDKIKNLPNSNLTLMIVTNDDNELKCGYRKCKYYERRFDIFETDRSVNCHYKNTCNLAFALGGEDYDEIIDERTSRCKSILQ